jgi:hypothetical protein
MGSGMLASSTSNSKVHEDLENMQTLFATSFSLDPKQRSVWQISSLDEGKVR